MTNVWDGITNFAGGLYRSLPGVNQEVKEVEKIVVREVEMLTGYKTTRLFVRLAGVSGAAAVIMAAYGAHVFKQSDAEKNMKETFDSGNRMHLIHSVALLGVPLTRKPLLVGSLLSLGIILFSGSCYVHALTGNTGVRKITPYGGMCFIFGWLAMIL